MPSFSLTVNVVWILCYKGVMYTLHVDVLVNNPATKLHIRSQVGHLAHCATINIFFGHPPFAARGGWNYV